MGIFLNPSNSKFQEALNSEIHVDKSGMLAYINSVIRTEQKYLCISRPRRFGKSMAANMMISYYAAGNDSRELFAGLEISGDASFEEHLNKYNVIFLNMQNFLSKAEVPGEMTAGIEKYLLKEMLLAYPDFSYLDDTDFLLMMQNIAEQSGKPFVVIIDEWDCLFREYRNDKEAQTKYLDFLRNSLKDNAAIALAYMTGILPIKKYGTHSALNMFTEYSMTQQGALAKFTGFTQEEVASLCVRYDMDLADMESWYNGYRLSDQGTDIAIYSPRSVVTSLMQRHYDGYWTQTETFEALRIYIDLDFDGLRSAVVALLAGDRIKIDISSFTNDMVTFEGYEDVLTLLVHLGYLGYDLNSEEVFIPNKEISKEYVTAMKRGYGEVVSAVKASDELLSATWQEDAEAVAAGIESAHRETAHLTYNSETALSYTISLAYYAAREYYTITREQPAGKGFADLVFVPRPNHPDKPAMIVELKWDKSAQTAIGQIKEKQYPKALEGYRGDLLLVGVNYSKKSKKHECLIERVQLP